MTALNAHPAYSVSVETFIDAAAEPGVTMVRPRGVLVGVKLSPEELNDDREVGNGNGCERDDEVLAAGDDASASLLEDVLAGAASPSDICGPTNTILLGGHGPRGLQGVGELHRVRQGHAEVERPLEAGPRHRAGAHDAPND